MNDLSKAMKKVFPFLTDKIVGAYQFKIDNKTLEFHITPMMFDEYKRMKHKDLENNQILNKINSFYIKERNI